jgi:hypothetical protein
MLIGMAERLRENIGTPRQPDEMQEYEAMLSALRETLDQAGLCAAVEAGRSLTLRPGVELPNE